MSFWFPQRKTVLLNAFLFTAESTFDAPSDNLFRCSFPAPRLGHETHDTDRSQGCHCSSPQQIQPWEPCCEKYLIDVQPIEHNCVSYITGMQYCNHAIQSLGILSWKASMFVKVSVIIGGPVRFLCLPPNPQATSCLLILFHKTSSPLSSVRTSSAPCHRTQTGGHGDISGESHPDLWVVIQISWQHYES